MWLILETKTDLFILLCRERKELLMWQLKNNVIVMTKLCLKDNWKHKFFFLKESKQVQKKFIYIDPNQTFVVYVCSIFITIESSHFVN